jgi:NAD(P)H dehydrogenase (quinone)
MISPRSSAIIARCSRKPPEPGPHRHRHDRPDHAGRPPHALVVTAHPAAASLTHAVATAIADALPAHGFTGEVADLVAEGFDPVFGAPDHAAFASGDAVPVDVRAEQQRIDRADHLILVFPVYWWAMPALLKGWIDRVFVARWAFDAYAEGRIVKRLGRLTVSLVGVAGADQATYDKHGYADAMRTQIAHGVFDFCGARVVASHLITPDPTGTYPGPIEIARMVTAPLSQGRA